VFTTLAIDRLVSAW